MTVQRQQFLINLKPVFDALETPLELVEDPERRRQFEGYLTNSRTHQERALLSLLSEIVTNFNEAAGLQARLELQGDGYVVNVEHEAEDSAPVFDAEEVERVTLRLPRELKKLIDQAAERSGVSTNTWYVRNLARSIARSMQIERATRGGDFGWGFRTRGRRRRGRGTAGTDDTVD